MRAFLATSDSRAGRSQHAASMNSLCNCFSRGSPFKRHFLLNYNPTGPVRGSTIVRVWQQVIDQASGKPYYWNTATNETAWELPRGEAVTSSSSSSSNNNSNSRSSSASRAVESTQQLQQQQQGRQEDPAGPTMSYDMLYSILQDAYNTDGSGMQFWEVARAHRQFGVFDVSFFEYLEQKQQQLTGADEAGKKMAFKIMCRLSNPLLRQPAPFEH